MKKILTIIICAYIVFLLSSCASTPENAENTLEIESENTLTIESTPIIETSEVVGSSSETIINIEDNPPKIDIISDYCFIYQSDEFHLQDYISITDDIDENLIEHTNYEISPDFTARAVGTYTVKLSATDSSSNTTKKKFILHVLSDTFRDYDGCWKTDSNTGNEIIRIEGDICYGVFSYKYDWDKRPLFEKDGCVVEYIKGIEGGNPNLSLSVGNSYSLNGDELICDDYRYDIFGTDTTPVEHHTYSYQRCTLEEFNQAVNDMRQKEAEMDALNQLIPPSPKPNQSQQPESNPLNTTTIESGTYLVGTDISAGTYRLTATSSYGGYWERAKNATGELDSIIANENFENSAYVTAKNGDFLKLVRCIGTYAD